MEMSCHNVNGKIHIINIIQARKEGRAEIFLYLAWHCFILTLIFGKKKKSSKNPGTDCYCRGNYGGHATLRALQFFLSPSLPLRAVLKSKCPKYDSFFVSITRLQHGITIQNYFLIWISRQTKKKHSPKTMRYSNQSFQFAPPWSTKK